jgi:collagenase-like PrtC family protease
MRYSVPTNWQPDLLGALRGLPVAEIYGQLPRDFVGGGRASYIIGRVSRRTFRAHVRAVRESGRSFDYTLNAPTMANREWSRSGQRQLAALVDRLREAGVDTVTVAIPYLLDYLKTHAPELHVSVSTQALVATPDKARRWQDLGADAITLSVLDVNRDFRTLERIRRAVDLRLQLIGNLVCTQGCPAGPYHAAINAHASQTGMSRFVIDYCVIDCTRRRLADPAEIIRAGWIRPEDQRIYEDIGIDRIKLVTKAMRTDVLANIVRAYAEERSPADLSDLFPSPDKSLAIGRLKPWHLVQHFFKPHRVNLLRLSKMFELTGKRRFSVDSAAIPDDFLQPFLDGTCSDTGCGGCRHCEEIAERAVRFGEGYREAAVAAHDRAVDDVLSGHVFRYLPRFRSRR